MNKERARELIKQVKNKIIKESTYEEIQEPESKNISILQEQIQALDIAIESLDENERLKKERDYILEKAKAELKDNDWVDVRDRLPSDDEIAENYGEFEITYFDTILKHQVTIAEFCKSNKYAIVEKDERGYWYDWEDDEIINVIAWRPLPKPYERKE